MRVILALVCQVLSLAALAHPFTLDDTAEDLGMSRAVISPDGKHIVSVAYAVNNIRLILTDTETGVATMLGGSGFYGTPIWVGNELIVVRYGEDRSYTLNLRGEKVAQIDGEVLAKVDPDNPDSTRLLVKQASEIFGLAVADATVGKLQKLSFPMSGVLQDWLVDTHGVLRAVTLRNTAFWSDDTKVSNWYRSDANSEWIKLAEFATEERLWLPAALLGDDQLMVYSSIGRDTYAMFAYDTRSRQLGELMAGHPRLDLVGMAGADMRDPRLVVTSGMKPERYWLDDKWAAAQAAIDLALPARVNNIQGDPSGKLLVYSWSDIEPGEWYLADLAHGKLSLLARTRLKVASAAMRPKEILSYRARDGWEIPAYLTRPADRQLPSPLVVLIHGGPWVRDSWAWSEEVQLLAAHGYAVFQPQFRGSAGFGRKFMEAGFGQWGLSMQDDITDGVRELIARGIADPGRICIYGASYGGYAALWGRVKTPELYRCGVSFAGVSDIRAQLAGGSDANQSGAGREALRFMIGDLKRSQAQFDAVSPLQHADRIQGPVLLVHGREDRRVPLWHSRNMAEALRRNGKTYQFELLRTGHGFGDLEQQKIFYDLLFSFLDKYIGPPAQPVSPP